MLFGVIDILFSCTPRLFTSETMVHHDRARLYHTACGGFLRTIRSSEGIGEETKHTKCSLFNMYEVKIKPYTTALYLASILGIN